VRTATAPYYQQRGQPQIQIQPTCCQPDERVEAGTLECGFAVFTLIFTFTIGTAMRTIGVLVLCAASLSIGYYLAPRTVLASDSVSNTSNIEVRPDKNDGEDIYDGDLAAVDGVGQCKLVLVVRTDLNMSTGKIAAQYVP
jgi:Peptidyl-tRNA hydrolase PTH2